MVGNNDNNEPRGKYHFKRRNAFVGNLKYNRPRGVEDAEQGEDQSSKNRPQSLHERIRSAGGIKHHRPSRIPVHSRLKYRLSNKNWQDVDGDELMKNNEGTSSQLGAADTAPQNPYRVRNNLKSNILRRAPRNQAPIQVTKTYAIGEIGNDTIKPLQPSQAFCKLKNIDQNIFDLIVNFLQQYFMCYDSNRQELLAAYHKNALFSLSLNVNSQSAQQTTKFGSYFKESRNLLYVSGQERLYKMLHSGNLDIVAFLSKMPKTEHDSGSLKLDSCFLEPNMLTFSVTGVFKEGETDKPRHYRSFQRVFVCIPTQTGQMIIVNEQYTISNLSRDQSKVFVKEVEASTPKMNQAEPLDPVLASLQDSNKQNMTIQFSKYSNLNLKWSKDCLEFANWNYEQAVNAFNSHRSDIPADAFIQK